MSGGGIRARGITYDTGTFPGDLLTRKTFDPEQVRREMTTIATQLHCDAVRVTGRDIDRLELAARIAAEAGLEVWFSPFPIDLAAEEMMRFFGDCAVRAEAMRQEGAEVVFVAGCELSIFGDGFLPGATHRDRLQAVATADMAWWASLDAVPERLNAFLARTAAHVRRDFGGRITYASGLWEPIDWTPFDLVSVDAYGPADDAGRFALELREHLAHGKPLAVTEFGTCAYRGASDLGAMAWQPPPGPAPDEDEQVRYLERMLEVFEDVGVDTALWFSFANYDKPQEKDIASYGVVRLLDESRWEPKKVFAAMASTYGVARDASAGRSTAPDTGAPSRGEMT